MTGVRGVVGGAKLALAGVALAIVMTWPLVLHLGSDVTPYIGDPLFQAWQVAWIGQAVIHHPFDLFQANIAWPLPDSLAFSDALVGYAPAGLVAQSGPDAALVTYNLLVLFAYALAFVGAYYLARELGAGAVGGTVAGAAFAYAPWRLGQTGHLHVISSGGIPLALFLLVRGYPRRDWRLVLAGWLVAGWQMTLGFTLGLQLLYLLVILGCVALALWLQWRRPALGPRVAVATAAGAVAFALLALSQAAPYVRVLHDHPEARRTVGEVMYYSPPIEGFVAAPAASFVWGDATASAREPSHLGSEQTLFPGVTILLLALVGAFASTYPRSLRFWLSIGTMYCGLLSLGIHSDSTGAGRFLEPYRVLYELVPGWDGVRTPGRLNTLTSLGLALLAAAGARAAVRLAGRLAGGRVASRRVAGAVTAILVGAILLEGLGPPNHPRVPAAPAAQDGLTAPQLHLPFTWYAAIRYAYWSTDGFPEIVNAYGAFRPTELIRLGRVVQSFPDARSVTALRRLGVHTVVLHPDLARGTAWQGTAGRPIDALGITRERAPGIVVFGL